MAKSTCAQCNNTFSGLTTFDQHQKSIPNDPRLGVKCLEPAELGLVNNDGTWTSPAPENGFVFHKESKPPKVYDCVVCGNPFQNTPGRGRPPSKCSNCGGRGIPLA